VLGWDRDVSFDRAAFEQAAGHPPGRHGRGPPPLDAGPDTGLVIRVYGEDEGGPAADAAFREMLASLRMYDDRFGRPAVVKVQAPTRASLARAMAVLGREEAPAPHPRPGAHHLRPAPHRSARRPARPHPRRLAPAPPRLMRDIFLTQVADLRLTPESQQILADDLRKLLSEDYLAMIAEHEERVQRPRVTHLARRCSGSSAALPPRAPALARPRRRHRRLHRPPGHGDVGLRDLPLLLREQITAGIEEFLWVETSTEIQGALRSLFAEHRSAVTVDPAPLEREAYREFAGPAGRSSPTTAEPGPAPFEVVRGGMSGVAW